MKTKEQLLMEIEKLKAHAYDCLANIEMWKKELQVTNQRIAELSQKIQKKEIKKSQKIN